MHNLKQFASQQFPLEYKLQHQQFTERKTHKPLTQVNMQKKDEFYQLKHCKQLFRNNQNQTTSYQNISQQITKDESLQSSQIHHVLKQISRESQSYASLFPDDPNEIGLAILKKNSKSDYYGQDQNHINQQPSIKKQTLGCPSSFSKFKIQYNYYKPIPKEKLEIYVTESIELMKLKMDSKKKEPQCKQSEIKLDQNKKLYQKIREQEKCYQISPNNGDLNPQQALHNSYCKLDSILASLNSQ